MAKTDRPSGRRGTMSGALGHLALVGLCVLAGLGVGRGVERHLTEMFINRYGHEAVTAIELVDAFVGAYTAERARLSADAAAIPPEFRAHALARFAAGRSAGDGLRIVSVGMPGRAIATPPYDRALADVLEGLALGRKGGTSVSLADIGGWRVLRAVLPSIAGQQSCVDCHNARQPSAPSPWRLGDVLGALVVEMPAEEALGEARRDGATAAAATALGGYLFALAALLLAGRRDRLRRSLQRTADERIVGAIENLSAGIALFDRDDRLIVANPAYRRTHAVIADILVPGVPFETILRTNVQRSRFDLGEDEAEAYIQKRLAQHRDPGPPIERRLSDGRWEQVREQRLADGGISLVILDITAEKEREAALEHAKIAAEAANRAKSQFLATVSHELRTPLNAIIGFAEIVQMQLFGPNAIQRYAGYAKDISESARHLLAVINDILDMSKIEAGRYELEKREAAVADLVDACLKIMRGRASEGRVAVARDVPEGLPAVMVDPRAMKQILLNLIANAIKFTPEGGKLTVGAALEEDGGLALKVGDTGIGIAPDELARVCEPFHQADATLARKHEGTGLGLSISRRLIEMHGGSLAIESAVGQGTTVTVRLPPEAVLSGDKDQKGETTEGKLRSAA
jgi:two-component system cell cycle sensor histidine kinase PleC